MSDAIAGTAHVVEVAPPSVAAELASIVRLGMGIVFGSWLYVASVTGSDPTTRGLLPYQALISTRPSAEIRVFRELQEGLIEAEAVRSRTGAWPTTEALAADGVPPFAYDPTAGLHACRWVRTEERTLVNYAGVPEHPGAPAWLIVVREPAPGEPPDQPNEDEEHHRLADGTMLHVSTWLRAAATSAAPPFVRVPQAEGWTQVLAVGTRPR
jgi:hypothetical protein